MRDRAASARRRRPRPLPTPAASRRLLTACCRDVTARVASCVADDSRPSAVSPPTGAGYLARAGVSRSTSGREATQRSARRGVELTDRLETRAAFAQHRDRLRDGRLELPQQLETRGPLIAREPQAPCAVEFQRPVTPSAPRTPAAAAGRAARPRATRAAGGSGRRARWRRGRTGPPIGRSSEVSVE